MECHSVKAAAWGNLAWIHLKLLPIFTISVILTMLLLILKQYFYAQNTSATKEVLVWHIMKKSQHDSVLCHDEFSSSSGLLEVKDGGCLTERHLLWLWRPWRGERWLKWASNWIGCRGNLVRVPGWLALLPNTPPKPSLYPSAGTMDDRTVMVDLYHTCMSGCG